KNSNTNADVSFAQQPVHGVVKDAKGAPLGGATVTNKNSKASTATDADGSFSINASEGDILVISFVGYDKIEIKITSSTTALVVSSDRQEDLSEIDQSNGFRPGQTLSLSSSLNIVLSQKISSLTEIVINKGYYKEQKKFSTGNVSKVTSKDIEQQPVLNPLLALQGRVPGLFITQANGLPGSGVTVRIQGQNSIGKGNDPLYVIDGVPYISQLPSTFLSSPLGSSGGPVINGVQSGSGNPLSYINPGDIESIEVLKDADATAIYGSRAANGAILITTKKGIAGQTKLDVNLQAGGGKVTRTLDLLNNPKYLEMRREALRNDGLSIGSTDYDINGTWDTTRYTNWQKELIGNVARYNNIQVNVSGGTSNLQYLIGGTFRQETYVFPGDFVDNKGSVHFNVNNVSKNQKFKISLSGNYLIDNNKLPSTDLTNIAITLAPDAPELYNSNGSLNWEPISSGSSTVSTWANPLANLLRVYKTKTNNIISSVNLSYKIFSGFEVSSNFGFTDLQAVESRISPIIAFPPEKRADALRTTSYANNSVTSWIIEPQINYRRSFKNGKLEALVGTTIQQNNTNGFTLTGIGYNSDLVLEDLQSATS
ncbi:MAG TPA: TonB-dependent receptor plug domain-containing protein, partial [Puia sp.]|nr:TonB-dependent receptor plug domain-containing protein [Puia sp.]